MKNFYKISLFTLAIAVNVFAYLFFIYEIDAVENISCKHSISNLSQEDFSYYKTEDITNLKGVPKEFEDAIITAYFFFPELKNVPIQFIEEKISTTMNCRPNPWRLLIWQRHYEIRINNYSEFEGPLLKDTPYNAQVGVIAHELAHILDYEAGGTLRIIKRALDYLRATTKRDFEHEIDAITIQKGFGKQLLDWLDFLMDEDNPSITEAYRNFKQDIYLDKENLSKLILDLDC